MFSNYRVTKLMIYSQLCEITHCSNFFLLVLHVTVDDISSHWNALLQQITATKLERKYL